MRPIANPILSIITINYNNASGLVKTMQSVIGQSWQDFEHIVVDGGSTDKSKDVILQYADRLTHWVSEPDQGIYHAMNKGIHLASGAYLLFLNSGDLLKDPSVLEIIYPYLVVADIVYGDIECVPNQGKSWVVYPPSKLSFQFFIKKTIPHQSAFIRRELFDKYGLYDEKLKICADWKFFVEVICKHNVSYKYVPCVVASYFLDGISSMEENRVLTTQEKQEYLSSNYLAFMPDYQSFERLNKSKWVKFLKKVHLLK
ncbi:MAG: glycosyltransferase family 2 protein [Sphingobacteriaceae bacterium]